MEKIKQVTLEKFIFNLKEARKICLAIMIDLRAAKPLGKMNAKELRELSTEFGKSNALADMVKDIKKVETRSITLGMFILDLKSKGKSYLKEASETKYRQICERNILLGREDAIGSMLKEIQKIKL